MPEYLLIDSESFSGLSSLLDDIIVSLDAINENIVALKTDSFLNVTTSILTIANSFTILARVTPSIYSFKIAMQSLKLTFLQFIVVLGALALGAKIFYDLAKNWSTMSDAGRMLASVLGTVAIAIAGVVAGLIPFNITTIAIAGVIGLLVFTIGKFISVLKGAKDESTNVAENLGTNISDGLLSGILAPVKNIGTWIKSNLIEPLLCGVKEPLQIASPSKVMAEIGKNIMEGLFGGISSMIGKVIDTFKEIYEGIVAFVSEIIEVVKAYFEENGQIIYEKFMSIMNSVVELFSTAWDAICVVAQAVFDFLKGFWDEYGATIITVLTAAWEFIVATFENVIAFLTGIFNIIIGLFTGNGDLIKEGLGQVWQAICGIFQAGLDFIGAIFSAIWGVICIIFGNIQAWFAEKFQAAWDAIKNVFSSVGDFFGGVWNRIVSLFNGIGSAIGNAIGDAFKYVVNSVIGFAENMINGFIKAINAAIKLINAIPGVEISYLTPLSIPRLAAGGLVDAGQLFVAREAGPELVGRFGNMTAVMNNGQIVEAVAGGVYSAVSAAMSGNSSSEQPLNVTLKVGETDFGKIVVNSINSLSRVQGSVNLAV